MTVVSEVSQVWASSVMVELATPSGSSMTRCATRRSAGGREGSSERTRTTVLSGGAVAALTDPAPGASAATRSSLVVFFMAESFLQCGHLVNGQFITVATW